MANLTTSAVIDAFMDADTAAAARTAIGIELTQAASSTLTQAGGHALTFTTTGVTSLTLPTAGTIPTTTNTLAVFGATTSNQLRGVISDETGTGSLVFATSPTLVTPTLGVATATSVNKVAITAPATSATLTIADGGSLITSGAFSITFTATAGTGVTLPTSGTLYGTASGSITSLQLKTSLSDETGSGAAVFANTPTLVTPVIGAATGTSLVLSGALTAGTINSVTLATGGPITFTLPADDLTFVTSGSTTLTLPTTGTVATRAGVETLTNKTLTSPTMTAPVLGVATATSLAAAGAITSSAGGILSTGTSGGIGYDTGAGSTAATAGSSPNFTATINRHCGQITTAALTTAGGAEEYVVVTNSAVDSTDVVVVGTTYTSQGRPMLSVMAIGAGVFTVVITNVDASALNAVLTINFAVIKGVSS
jgi:hypothetical protein